MRKMWLALTVLALAGSAEAVGGESPSAVGAGDCGAADLAIATGSPKGTYFKVAQDLKALLKHEGITLCVKPTNGTIENVKLLNQSDVQLAFVQWDYIQTLIAQANRGELNVIRNLRVVLRLYPELLHLVVRKGSPLTTLDQILDKRIYIGPLMSGTQLSVAKLYEGLHTKPKSVAFDGAPAVAYSNALFSLVNNDGLVEIVAYMGGTPLDQLDVPADTPYQLLTLKNPKERFGLFDTFTIPKGTYPWLDRDVMTVGSWAYLITRVGRNEEEQLIIDKALAGLANGLCKHIRDLRRNERTGQTWQDVSWNPSNPRLDLEKPDPEITYAKPSYGILSRCPSPPN